MDQMTEETAAGRKPEDPFEAILLEQIQNCSAGLNRGFATMAKHEEITVTERWKPYQYVDLFLPQRASLMRMVEGTARLATAAARLRHEASLNLKLTQAIANGGQRATAKNAGSIPKQNVANDAATIEAAE